MEIEEIARQIVDSAIKVHRTLGAGLLESAYQTCLAHELSLRGLKVECEVMLPIVYEGAIIDNGFRVDMIVNDLVIIEKNGGKINPDSPCPVVNLFTTEQPSAWISVELEYRKDGGWH